MNEKILELLKLLSIQKKNDGERFKHLAILKALGILKKYSKEIKTLDDIDDVKGLPGIGDGMIKRLTEIIKTGKLKELDNTPELFLIKELTTVSGIGEKNAQKLISEHKIKSLSDLKKQVKNGKIELTTAQTIGLKYYDDLNQRIPRAEITKAKGIINKIIKKIDPDINMEIVGSYRRKKKDSGDIDVLFTHKKNYLNQVVKSLEDSGYLLEQISKGGKKYSGIFKIQDYGRRIDILFIQPENYPAALLYFTGSGEHNQKMRAVAKSKGFKLNEYSLLDENGNKIKVKTEEDIFKKLEMEFLEPQKREIK
jgi:DNA polymerase beta